MNKFFVTGGAGFIGSCFVRKAVETGFQVLNYDNLTYASDKASLASVERSKSYQFVKGDICDRTKLKKTIEKFSPNVVVHFAAESHVDNSIESPIDFINTNILGTYNLLTILNEFHAKNVENCLRFIHISTDEVYGDLKKDEDKFTTQSRYKPSSPYAASKASSDHLVDAWHRTYNFPSIVTHCSNNYGPWQHKEKFIPTIILNALKKKKIPIYGTGENIRDWIHVEDHVDALMSVIEKGVLGKTYNIGSSQEIENIVLARLICETLDKLVPTNGSYVDYLQFVQDRPGHDLRYSIDNSEIKNDLDWTPQITFENGVIETIKWYVRKYA